MSIENLTSPCGLACFECAVFKAQNNDALKEVIAQKLQIPSDEVVCRGCRNENGTIPVLKMCCQCSTFACAAEKGHQFCSECDNFPCDHIMPRADRASSVPHNLKVYNLCQIKRMGLENWAEQMAAENLNSYYHKKVKLSESPE